MSHFTPGEIEYFKSQRLGRLATVSPSGQPHVVPVSFRYNPETDTVDIGGLNLMATKKVRDITHEPRVAFVIDDVLPPWQARGIEIRGHAQIMSSGGKEIMESFAPEIIRIVPSRIISWGINTDAYHASSRKVA